MIMSQIDSYYMKTVFLCCIVKAIERKRELTPPAKTI